MQRRQLRLRQKFEKWEYISLLSRQPFLSDHQFKRATSHFIYSCKFCSTQCILHNLTHVCSVKKYEKSVKSNDFLTMKIIFSDSRLLWVRPQKKAQSTFFDGGIYYIFCPKSIFDGFSASQKMRGEKEKDPYLH